MKMKKIILVISVMSFFAFTTISAQAGDCSGYKTFSHKWIMCKGGKAKSFGKNGVSTESNKGSGKIGNFFKKIKNAGGKNVGEPG